MAGRNNGDVQRAHGAREDTQEGVREGAPAGDPEPDTHPMDSDTQGETAAAPRAAREGAATGWRNQLFNRLDRMETAFTGLAEEVRTNAGRMTVEIPDPPEQAPDPPEQAPDPSPTQSADPDAPQNQANPPQEQPTNPGNTEPPRIKRAILRRR